MWDDSTHVHYIIFTCSVAILLATPSHIAPASDSLPPPHLPCGPALAPMGGAAASATVQRPPAADLSATRGVERGASFGFDHHLLDLGAEPRLDVIRDGLQYSRLLDRDNLPESLDYRGFDPLRVLGG